MRILVTGRHGQVAQSLAERAAHHEDLELLFAARPEVDLAQAGAIAAAIESARPDAVINAAAFTEVDRAEDEPERAFRINADAAGEAAAAAARIGCPIIHLSTDYVFDGMAKTPYGEGAATNPLNVYGASKLLGEERVRAASDRHLIVRTAWLVGPFGKNFVKTMLRLAGDRDEIKVVADQFGCPTDTLMLADAILAIVRTWQAGAPDAGLGQTFHVAGKGACSWADLARRVMATSVAAGGAGARIIDIPTSEYPTKAHRPAYSVLDTHLFERSFDVVIPDWQVSIDAVVRRLVSDAR